MSVGLRLCYPSREAVRRLSQCTRGGFLWELLSKSGDFFAGGRPDSITCSTVEHQRAGFQRRFKFFTAECNGLIVVVRACNFEVDPVAHSFFLLAKLPLLRGCQRGVFQRLLLQTGQAGLVLCRYSPNSLPYPRCHGRGRDNHVSSSAANRFHRFSKERSFHTCGPAIL